MKIEQFSLEYEKVIYWFCIARYVIGLKKLAQTFKPIRGKTKTNRDSLALVFPRFSLARCSSLDWFTGLTMLPGQGAYDVFGLRRSVENYSLANKPVVTLGKRGKSLVEWTDLIG